MKRVLAVTLGLFFCLLPVFAQQNSDSQKKSDKEQKSKKEENQPAAQKPAETAAVSEQKNEPSKEKDDDKDKEEHYDVSEVAPVVTHHQITVNGSVLKYTATAGRLPLKRGDGKTEAEMFFVARSEEGRG